MLLTAHELRVLLVSGAVALAATLGADLVRAAYGSAQVSHQVVAVFLASA